MSTSTIPLLVLQTSSGLVVTEDGFPAYMPENRLHEVVEGLLSKVDFNSREELRWPVAQIKEIIHSARIPDPIYRTIKDCCQELDGAATLVWPTTIPYEVYYGSGECRQSFHLKVRGLREMCEAIKWWWGALYDAKAIHYREQGGLNHRYAAISVAVQRVGAPEI